MTLQIFDYAVISLAFMLPRVSILKSISIVLRCRNLSICLVGDSFFKEIVLWKMLRKLTRKWKMGNMVDYIVIQKIFAAIPCERMNFSTLVT